MKLLLIIFALTLAITPSSFANVANAATSCDPDDTSNNGGCSANEYCDARVTSDKGGTCESQTSFNPTSAVPVTPAADNSNTGNAVFTPLTQLPGIQDAASSATLPNFLNQLYRICIGAGAVLAVIMIMIAGVQFMTSRGSVSSNEKAKARIQNAILGLILLLSPTIVFSIINPDILNLSLDFSDLKSANLQHATVNPSPDLLSGTWESTRTDAASLCSQQGGTPTDLGGGNIRCTAKASSCRTYPSGNTSITPDQEACCTAQKGCTLLTRVKSQTSCVCQAATQ